MLLWLFCFFISKTYATIIILPNFAMINQTTRNYFIGVRGSGIENLSPLNA